MFGAPVGFLLSAVGLIVDKRKRLAFYGLVLSAIMIALFCVLTLCS